MSLLQAVMALLAFGSVLLLPGLAWQAWFPRPRLDPLERLAEAVAFSVSITALGGLACYLVHLPVRLPGIFAIYALVFALLVTGLWRYYAESSGRFGIEAAASLLLGAFILLWRYYQISNAAAAPELAMVIQKIFAAGGVPVGLGPEQPVPFVDPVSYPLLAALFARLGDLPSIEAVPLMGAALTGAVSLSIYRLAKAVWGEWRHGILALLLSVFLFQLPAGLADGQRFAMAAGLVVLPVVMARLWQLDQFCHNKPGAEPSPQSRLLVVILSAGTSLSHPLALVLLLLFAGILAGTRLVTLIYRWPGWRRVYGQVGLPLVLVLDGVILASPWLLRVLIEAGSLPAPHLEISSAVFYILTLILMVVAAVAMLRCLLRGGWGARRLAVWSVLLALLALPVVPRAGLLAPGWFGTLLSLPASLFLADGVMWVFRGKT